MYKFRQNEISDSTTILSDNTLRLIFNFISFSCFLEKEMNKPAKATTKRQSSVKEYLDNMDKKIVETVKRLAKSLHLLSSPKSNQKDTTEENDHA